LEDIVSPDTKGQSKTQLAMKEGDLQNIESEVRDYIRKTSLKRGGV
jgi:hypothetical protein